MRAFRLCKERYSASVLSGDGGRHADGRWHRQGRPIVYCAGSESLAVLELRVHIGQFLPRERFIMHAINVPDETIELLSHAALPPGWNSVPHSTLSQNIGDAWLEQQRSLALQVPSIHSKSDCNILLNPAHPSAAQVSIDNARIYLFDPRLFAG
jgi:RES domain-containing protein